MRFATLLGNRERGNEIPSASTLSERAPRMIRIADFGLPGPSGLLLLALISWAPSLSAQGLVIPADRPPLDQVSETLRPDTLVGIREVRRLLIEHYQGQGLGFGPAEGALPDWARDDLYRDPYCDGGTGALCHGGDPDQGPCRAGATCHPTTEFLLAGLTEAAIEYPSSEFILGQAVYALTKFNRSTEALVLANRCEGNPWFCDAIRGYVIHAQGGFAEAEPFLRRAMAAAPIPEMCAYGDATWLLGEWSQKMAGLEDLPDAWEKTRDMPCLDKLEASDTLFWWADPLFAVEGNDRWVEHIARALGLRFYRELGDVLWGIPVPQRYVNHDWAHRIRRGVWDSYQNPQGVAYSSWTSEEKARYHFVPDVELDDLSRPRWKLEADLFDEGFTPRYGPLFGIPVQVARFRAEGALLVAVAGDLASTPLSNTQDIDAHFILSDGPESVPLHLTGRAFRSTSIFLGEAPAREYVMSMEVLGSAGIGWHREVVSPLLTSGPELSDLLLFRPSAELHPDSLLQAAGLMLGSNTVQKSEGMGVYWETYGIPPETMLELELGLRRDSGGITSRLSWMIPGGSQEGYGPVRWMEEARAETHSGTVSLDILNLEPGEYELVLKVRWPGQPELVRSRRVQVEG